MSDEGDASGHVAWIWAQEAFLGQGGIGNGDWKGDSTESLRGGCSEWEDAASVGHSLTEQQASSKPRCWNHTGDSN